MKLSIILLNYNRKELTLACIASLHKNYQKQFEKNEFEIIIVDNLSTDTSVAFIQKALQKEKYKNTTLYPNSENAGFGKGCNMGAEYAKGEYLFFLNNDTEVLDNGCIGMTEFLDARPYVGILGGRLENADRSSQASAGKFYTLLTAIGMLLGLQRFGWMYTSPTTITKVDWVSGGSMMVRKSVFEKIGGFDPEIFMYMEDVELCFRARRAGFFTYFYPNVMITHIGQGSTNRTFAIVHIYEGLMHFYKKYMPAWQVWVIQCILKTKAIVLIGVGKVLKKPYLVTTYEQALAILR